MSELPGDNPRDFLEEAILAHDDGRSSIAISAALIEIAESLRMVVDAGHGVADRARSVIDSLRPQLSSVLANYMAAKSPHQDCPIHGAASNTCKRCGHAVGDHLLKGDADATCVCGCAGFQFVDTGASIAP